MFLQVNYKALGKKSYMEKKKSVAPCLPQTLDIFCFPPLCLPWRWDDGLENRGLWKAFDSSPAPKLECSSEPRQLLRCIRENQEGAHLFCTSRKTSSFAEVSSPVLFLGCGQGTSYHTREVKGGQHQSPAAHTMPPGDSHWKGSCQHIPCVTGTKNV